MTSQNVALLGDLVEILSGFPFESDRFSDSGDIPVVRIRDVVPGKSSTFYSGDYDPRYLLSDGDVLIGMDGDFNRAKWRGGRALLNQRVCRIRSTSTGLDDSYLFHFLPAALKLIWDNTPFVTVKHLSVKDIRAIKIPIPPIEEQRRIADILDRADALRAKRRAALARLDELTQAIFVEMFGDPVSNPKGWPRLNGDQICERITVGVVVQPASYYVERGIPALRSLNVRANRIQMDDMVYFSSEVNEGKLAKSRIRTGDVLMVRSGQPGTAAVVPDHLNGANAIDILIATPDCRVIQPHYFSFFMNSDGGKRIVLGEQRGQVQKHLNVGSLREASFPVPPIQYQEAFIRILTQITSVRHEMKSQHAHSEDLFSSLQDRAFRGAL